MKKRDRLTVAAGVAIGLTLTHSNNSGGWSRGEPYTETDIEFRPLDSNTDALELAEKLKIDIPFGSRGLSQRKARLYVTLQAARRVPAKRAQAVEIGGKICVIDGVKCTPAYCSEMGCCFPDCASVVKEYATWAEATADHPNLERV